MQHPQDWEGEKLPRDAQEVGVGVWVCATWQGLHHLGHAAPQDWGGGVRGQGVHELGHTAHPRSGGRETAQGCSGGVWGGGGEGGEVVEGGGR